MKEVADHLSLFVHCRCFLQEMKGELEKRIRIPYEHVKIGRRLMQDVIPIFVSLDNAWTIDKELLLSSLRQSVMLCSFGTDRQGY